MDASIFFKNGDPSEPRLNANGEGSFKQNFQGAFADEQRMNMCGDKEEPKLSITADDLWERAKGKAEALKQEAQKLKEGASDSFGGIVDALKGEDTKISTGTWVAIGLVSVVVLGGLGYILYKKYK